MCNLCTVACYMCNGITVIHVMFNVMSVLCVLFIDIAVLCVMCNVIFFMSNNLAMLPVILLHC